MGLKTRLGLNQKKNKRRTTKKKKKEAAHGFSSSLKKKFRTKAKEDEVGTPSNNNNNSNNNTQKKIYIRGEGAVLEQPKGFGEMAAGGERGDPKKGKVFSTVFYFFFGRGWK